MLTRIGTALLLLIIAIGFIFEGAATIYNAQAISSLRTEVATLKVTPVPTVVPTSAPTATPAATVKPAVRILTPASSTKGAK